MNPTPEKRSGSQPDQKSILELVTRARQGDEQAFAELYRLHVGAVHAVCLRLTADVTTAEILVQDAFVRAWRKLDRYEARGPFGAWLRRLAINVVMEDRRRDARRRQIIRPDFSRGDEDETAIEGSVPPPRTLTAIDLERAVSGLPEGARTAFVLHDVEGFRHREIAEMTGLATGTIKTQLHRARRLLRRALGDAQEALA